MHPVNSEDFGLHGMTVHYSVSGANSVTGYIVEQVGQTKYIVAPGTSTNAATFVTVTLATTSAQVANLSASSVGKALGTIVVSPFGGGSEHARKIFGRKLLTVEGHTYNWRKTTATHNGECNVAGNWSTGPDASGFSDKVNV